MLAFLLISESISSSTFHYGSIKMIANDKKVTDATISTFHYGSIKIHIYT